MGVDIPNDVFHYNTKTSPAVAIWDEASYAYVAKIISCQ